MVSFDVLKAEGCLIPDCVLWELACALLSPLCDQRQMKQGAITSPSSFSDTLRRPTKHPQALLRDTCTQFFRHRLSRDGLPLCLALSHTVFLLSAALMVCTVKPCVFPWKRPGRAAIRTSADSCLCCIPHSPSSYLLLFPFFQAALF